MSNFSSFEISIFESQLRENSDYFISFFLDLADNGITPFVDCELLALS